MVIDCLNMPAGANATAPSTLMDSIAAVKSQLGVNMTLGASNISFTYGRCIIIDGADPEQKEKGSRDEVQPKIVALEETDGSDPLTIAVDAV